MAHLLVSVALVAIATVLLVVGLVTDAGVGLIVLSILASVGAGGSLLLRRRTALVSSG